MLNMIKNSKLRLDKVDQKILFELDKNCRIPSTQISKKVGKSRQAVDYRINNLLEKGIITKFQTSINPHKIGYKTYKIYINLKNIPEEKEKLLKYLRKSGKVYWMGECSGSWDLIFAVFTKSDLEFFEFKNFLFSKFSRIIVNADGGNLLDVRQYPKMYFGDKERTENPVIFAGEVEKNKIDKLDSTILKKIVNNARISLVELSTKTKTSIQIIQGRLKRLEKNKTIIQYRIGVDLEKLDLELYKTIIKLERYTKEDEQKLLNYLSKIPNIQYFIRNIWQIEIELVVKSYQEYYKILDDLKKEFPSIIKTADTLLMKSDEWTPGFENILMTLQ